MRKSTLVLLVVLIAILPYASAGITSISNSRVTSDEVVMGRGVVGGSTLDPASALRVNGRTFANGSLTVNESAWVNGSFRVNGSATFSGTTWFNSAAQVNSSGGILWSGDTNLYRTGAGVLTTDGVLNAGQFLPTSNGQSNLGSVSKQFNKLYLDDYLVIINGNPRIALQSPNGNWWECGVTNLGTFGCSAIGGIP